MTITEQWARTAPAGPELDRVCAEWMGFKSGWISSDCHRCGGRFRAEWDKLICPSCGKIYWRSVERKEHRYSSKWEDAGPLLEAMKGCVEWDDVDLWTAYTLADTPTDPNPDDPQAALATTPQLAIARACAVLVARGITRDDLGGR